MRKTWSQLANEHWSKLGKLSSQHLLEFETLFKAHDQLINNAQLNKEEIYNLTQEKLKLVEKQKREIAKAVKECHEEQIEFVENEKAEKRLEKREKELEKENDVKEKIAEKAFQQELEEEENEEANRKKAMVEELKARIQRLKDASKSQDKSLDRDKDLTR